MKDHPIFTLRDAGFPFAPPASDKEIERLERVLEFKLPTELAAMYRVANGMLPTEGCEDLPYLPLRLLPIDEAISVNQQYGFGTWGVRIFWSMDSANYAGLYTEGSLDGYVCIVRDDEPDINPVYRSTESFVSTILAAARQSLDWYELPGELPECEINADFEQTAKEIGIAQKLMKDFGQEADEDDRVQIAFFILALLPFQYTEMAMPFLSSDDPWIQERACELTGRRRYEPAVDQLAEIARSGVINADMAAIRALGSIGTLESQERLERLKHILPREKHGFVDAALRVRSVR